MSNTFDAYIDLDNTCQIHSTFLCKYFNYAFALSRQCLRILGVWPDPYRSSSDVRRSNVRFIIITCIVSLYVMIPQMTSVVRAWGNAALLVHSIASVNFCLNALCKLIATWYHGETLQKLITSFMEDWAISKSNWERNTMLKIARRSRSLSFKCSTIAACAIMSYICSYLLRFYRNIYQSQRSFIYQSITFVSPYNVQKSPNYEITYFCQLLGGVYAALINCSIDNFISMLVLHLCAQLINLRMTLNNLVDALASESISSLTFKKGLAAIIVRHEYLITNAKTIDGCYSAVLFVHMLVTIFQLCFQTFQIFTVITKHLDVSIFEMAFLTLYVVLMLTHLYMYCYSAERLLIESTSMVYGAYECKWYDVPSKNAKDLMFIMYRCTIPLKLTAGKFGAFSLEMFGIMLKTSMGYLSVMLTITD